MTQAQCMAFYKLELDPAYCDVAVRRQNEAA